MLLLSVLRTQSRSHAPAWERTFGRSASLSPWRTDATRSAAMLRSRAGAWERDDKWGHYKRLVRLWKRGSADSRLPPRRRPTVRRDTEAADERGALTPRGAAQKTNAMVAWRPVNQRAMSSYGGVREL